MKTPFTEIIAKGEIPKRILNALKKEFGNEVKITDNDDSVNVFETDWYERISKKWNPGESVRIYRTNLKMSQGQLAEKLGILPTHVSEIERGKRGISKEMAKKLAKLFKTSVARFV